MFDEYPSKLSKQRVVRLWSGEVDSLDNALRLLLIIDYIADWARDIYREGIARSLYKLASSDSTSLAQDEDIFSLAGNVADWISANPSGDEFGKCAAYEDPLHELDCKEGVLRDTRFICTELVGLLITAENLDEFLRTGNTDDETRKLTTSLLYSIADSFQVKGSVLNDLETSWTGFDKSLPEMPHPEETFLVVITSRFYLTSKWDQVRELAYVAVSKSLVKDLRGIARVPNNTFRSLQEAPMVKSLVLFNELLARSARDNLSACLSSLNLTTLSVLSSRDKFHKSAWRMLPLHSEARPNTIEKQIAIKFSIRTKTQDFISDIYSRYKVGRNIVTASILRSSSALDEVVRAGRWNPRSFWPNIRYVVWPWRNWANLRRGEQVDDIVLVRSEECTCPCPRKKDTELCIFILNPFLTTRGISPNLFSNPPSCHLLLGKENCQMESNNLNNKIPISDCKEELARCLNAFKVSLGRPLDRSLNRPKSKWATLLQGWESAPVTDERSLPPRRPFRRCRDPPSLQEVLLGRATQITMANDPSALRGHFRQWAVLGSLVYDRPRPNLDRLVRRGTLNPPPSIRRPRR